MITAAPSDEASGRQPGQGEVVLALTGIVKTFGATKALRGVDLVLRKGEFVGLLGPNGAGKSTLIKILDGVESADEGTIQGSAKTDGLGVVHQDLGLVETMTIAENVFLGGASGRWINPRAEAEATSEALRLVGLEGLDPHALVETLSLGQRTMVAVARLLRAGARVVVVDEVTAGLNPAEAEWLVQKLRDAAHAAATVVMVTHKLREIMGVADRFVVLMDGQTALDKRAADTSLSELVDTMSVRRSMGPISEGSQSGRGPGSAGQPVGEIVCALRDVRTERAGPIDIDIRAGLITGLTGLVGSGIHDLAYVVAGRQQPISGTVDVPPTLRRSCVPAHRETEGMFVDESEEFNLTAGVWSRWAGRLGLLDTRRLSDEAHSMAEHLSIIPRDLEAPLSALSGGNQQKAMLGRALIDEPQLLVLCEPTRGVDVATRRDIYQHVKKIAAEGTAVFIASSDLEDLVALADTAAILGSDGHLGPWVPSARVADLADELVQR